MNAKSKSTKDIGALSAPDAPPRIPRGHYRLMLADMSETRFDKGGTIPPKIARWCYDISHQQTLHETIEKMVSHGLLSDVRGYSVAVNGETVDPTVNVRPPDGATVVIYTKRNYPLGTIEDVPLESRKGLFKTTAKGLTTSPQMEAAYELLYSQPDKAAICFPPIDPLLAAVTEAVAELRALGVDESVAAILERSADGEIEISHEPYLTIWNFALQAAWHGRRAIMAIEQGTFDANTLADAVAAMSQHGKMTLAKHEDALVRRKPGREKAKGADAKRRAEFDRQKLADTGASDAELERRAAKALGCSPKTINRAREAAPGAGGLIAPRKARTSTRQKNRTKH